MNETDSNLAIASPRTRQAEAPFVTELKMLTLGFAAKVSLGQPML
jgi:hypothetical protein